MASGKLAYQRGEWAVAVEKWETLLRIASLDPQIEKAVAPFLADARAKAGLARARRPKPEASERPPRPRPPAPTPPDKPSETRARVTPPAARRPSSTHGSVSGMVSGGGDIGPGGAVLWLKRTDGPMPRIAAPTNQVVTQREKTFLPHVLAVPLGTTVQFRNDDRIYHNVFSIAKPNDFDAGIRATGATYTRTFNNPGPVEILCNIHSTMNGYVFVVDSPYYAKAQASGAFSIRGVPPGRTSWPHGTNRRPTSRARRSWSAATGYAIWLSRSAATNAPDPSSPTNTDTNASPSSATRMSDASQGAVSARSARRGRRAGADRRGGGAAHAARPHPGRRARGGRGTGGGVARRRRRARPAREPGGSDSERDRQPAAGRRARRRRRSGDAARSAADRAVVGAVPAQRRRFRPLRGREHGARDVSAAGHLRRALDGARRAPGPPRLGQSAAGGGTGAGGGGVPGGADRPFGMAGAGLDPDPRRRPDVRDGGARGRRRGDLRRAAAAGRGHDRGRRRRRRSGRAQARRRSARRPARSGSGRRPWPRCRCPAAVCACWSASPRRLSPGRHAAAVVGAGDPDHRPRVFDRPLRDACRGIGPTPDRGAGARAVESTALRRSAATRSSSASARAAWPRSTRPSPRGKAASGARL